MSHHRDSFGAETFHEENRVRPSASFKSQLSTWHANRGTKSFLAAMIPRAHVPVAGEEATTKNPIKLFRMVSLTGWLFFLSGWFAWTCDGYDFFAVSLTVTRLSEQFNVGTKVRLPSILWGGGIGGCLTIVYHNCHHPYAPFPVARSATIRRAGRSIRKKVDISV